MKPDKAVVEKVKVALRKKASKLNPAWENFHEQDWEDLAGVAVRAMRRTK